MKVNTVVSLDNKEIVELIREKAKLAVGKLQPSTSSTVELDDDGAGGCKAVVTFNN